MKKLYKIIMTLSLILPLIGCDGVGKKSKKKHKNRSQSNSMQNIPERHKMQTIEDMKELPSRVWRIDDYASDSREQDELFDVITFSRVHIVQGGAQGKYLLYRNKQASCAAYYPVEMNYTAPEGRKTTNEPFDLSFHLKENSALKTDCEGAEKDKAEATLDYLLDKTFWLRPTSVGMSDIWDTYQLVDRHSESFTYRYLVGSYPFFGDNKLDLAENLAIITKIKEMP